MNVTSKRECKDTILALDTASKKTGYAIYKNGEILDSGVWKLKQGEHLADLYKRIASAIHQYGISKIVAEDIYKAKYKSNAFERLAECRGTILTISQQKFIECYFISAVRAKEEVWGYNPKKYRTHRDFSRQQQKEIMIRQMVQRGYMKEDNTSDDEADALGLLVTYLKMWRYAQPRPKY